MTQVIVVRSTITDPQKRDEFDSWARNFVPEVRHKIKPDLTRRGWSLTNPAVHVTTFLFDNMENAGEAMRSISGEYLPEAQRQFPEAQRQVEHIDYSQEWLA